MGRQNSTIFQPPVLSLCYLQRRGITGCVNIALKLVVQLQKGNEAAGHFKGCNIVSREGFVNVYVLFCHILLNFVEHNIQLHKGSYAQTVYDYCNIAATDILLYNVITPLYFFTVTSILLH